MVGDDCSVCNDSDSDSDRRKNHNHLLPLPPTPSLLSSPASAATLTAHPPPLTSSLSTAAKITTTSCLCHRRHHSFHRLPLQSPSTILTASLPTSPSTAHLRCPGDGACGGEEREEVGGGTESEDAFYGGSEVWRCWCRLWIVKVRVAGATVARLMLVRPGGGRGSAVSRGLAGGARRPP